MHMTWKGENLVSFLYSGWINERQKPGDKKDPTKENLVSKKKPRSSSGFNMIMWNCFKSSPARLATEILDSSGLNRGVLLRRLRLEIII